MSDSKRIIRAPEAMRKLGLKKTAFSQNFVLTGRLRRIRITPKAVGYLEAEVDALVDELDNAPRVSPIKRYRRTA